MIKRLQESLIKSNSEVFDQMLEYENEPPAGQLKKIDENIIVPFLKGAQQNDPTIEIFKRAYHPNNPEVFDELLAELRKKSLI